MLQTLSEGAYSFKVSEGREKPWRKKGKIQTNRIKIEQIQFPQRILGRTVPSKFILTELFYLVYIIKGPIT